jgi:sulfate transport system ATP-binding protein
MSIILRDVSKRMSGQLVVDRVSLEVNDGELFVLLGQSGSGKSTILRMIAGLIGCDSGQVLLHGRDVTELPPQQRGVGFVFQNYSIFRHMTVAENIEFGLLIRGMSPAQRAERREQLLDLVGLVGLGKRRAHQLSGGQQQRVALARALAYSPQVLLLDEPFGALDAKIRTQVRRSLKEIQRKLGVTTVLVTHDQDEAFELADRLSVMERGHLLEVGNPEDLYRTPRSSFVATFLGAANVLVGWVRGERAHFGHVSLPIPAEVPHEDASRVQVLIRPEHLHVSAFPSEDGPLLGAGPIIDQHFSGAIRRVRMRLPRLQNTRQIAPLMAFGEAGMVIEANLPPDEPLPSGDVYVSLKRWTILQRPQPRVLVYAGTDDRAMGVARAISDKMGGALSVLGVAAGVDETDVETQRMRARQREAGVGDAPLRVRQGEAGEQVAAEHFEGVYDLLVMPSDGPIGSVLERSVAPVLVARPTSGDFKRILICTAAGEPGKSTVRFGGWLARRLRAHATLLYVALGSGEPTPQVRTHLEQAAETLSGLEVQHDVLVPTAERPAEGIVATAREGGYDVVIVGAPGPEVRPQTGLGDVTRQVIARAECSVIVAFADDE